MWILKWVRQNVTKEWDKGLGFEGIRRNLTGREEALDDQMLFNWMFACHIGLFL